MENWASLSHVIDNKILLVRINLIVTGTWVLVENQLALNGDKRIILCGFFWQQHDVSTMLD